MQADLRYDCGLDALSPELAERFVPLRLDAAAQRFVDELGARPHGRLATAAYALLRTLISDYDAYGLLGMYPMHLLSTEQLTRLLGERLRARLLDVGAGSGAVTAQAAPLFEGVTVTETSRVLARALARRGYRVVDHDLALAPWPTRERFDVVALLNVIDRCTHPRSLLQHARDALTDDGTLLVSVPLPLRPHVHVGRHTVDPEQPLPAPEPTWERGVSSLVSALLRPLGLSVRTLSRVPYLCRGDAREPLYVLDAAVLTCGKAR